MDKLLYVKPTYQTMSDNRKKNRPWGRIQLEGSRFGSCPETRRYSFGCAEGQVAC